MDLYLARFEHGVHDLGIQVAPRVIQSNGGAVTPGAVRRLPVNTFFSGPAGGVISSRGLGAQVGITNLITFDMGGTSTDVCLIRDGAPILKTLRELGGFPVRTHTIDIHTIGAGGGSIAWVDAGGLLKVDPMSASAQPGPELERHVRRMPLNQRPQGLRSHHQNVHHHLVRDRRELRGVSWPGLPPRRLSRDPGHAAIGRPSPKLNMTSSPWHGTRRIRSSSVPWLCRFWRHTGTKRAPTLLHRPSETKRRSCAAPPSSS
jgi:hypothetical protein